MSDDALPADGDLAGVPRGNVLRVTATAIPNALAALALRVRDLTGRRPHLYFSWGELNPALYLVKFLLTGKGDIAPLTREILACEDFCALKQTPLVRRSRMDATDRFSHGWKEEERGASLSSPVHELASVDGT